MIDQPIYIKCMKKYVKFTERLLIFVIFVVVAFFFQVPTFFLTDILRYKPIIVVEAFSLFATWALLVWGKTVWHMQIMQISFGILF